MLPGKDNLQYHGHERRLFKGVKHGRKRALSPFNELFATLMRLRLGLLEQDLADRFQVSEQTMSSILVTWIAYLHRELVDFRWWPSKERVEALLLSPEFQQNDHSCN